MKRLNLNLKNSKNVLKLKSKGENQKKWKRKKMNLKNLKLKSKNVLKLKSKKERKRKWKRQIKKRMNLNLKNLSKNVQKLESRGISLK